MYAKFLTALAVGALVSTAAFAQDQTASAKGLWQASKLIHLDVYNSNNEKIGDIKELLVDKSGKVEIVAIGVGGFLGMGERDVAVKFEELKWVDTAPARTSSNADRPNTTGANQSDNAQTRAKRNYPDHAVLNASKDQLKAMPQFDYNK